MKDMEKLHELQMKANSAKDKLISLESELRRHEASSQKGERYEDKL